MRLRVLFAFVFIAVLSAGIAAAQMPAGQWFMIHSEVVKPSMVKEYEESSRAFVEMVKANRESMPHFSFTGMHGSDFIYTYVVPIPNMAGVDDVNKDFMTMMTGPSGAQMMEILTHGNAAVEYIREWVVGEMPELSYTPASPRLKPEEVKYVHMDSYYIKADKAGEVEAIGKAFAELFKKHNIPDGYNVYMTVMGPEMPAVYVRTGAKDAADFRAAAAKNRSVMGAEFDALMNRAMSITRRFETGESWMRPDLSVMPPAK